jgi:hypothetical protein
LACTAVSCTHPEEGTSQAQRSALAFIIVLLAPARPAALAMWNKAQESTARCSGFVKQAEQR